MKTALALAVAIAVPGAAAADKTLERTLDATADAKVFVDSFKGKIEVRTADIAEVRVTARVWVEEGGDPESVEHVHLRTNDGGRRVRVEIEYDEVALDSSSSWFGWQKHVRPMVDLSIVMPEGGRLVLETHKAELDIEAPSGSVEIDTHKGHGTIRNVRSELDLDTHKGDYEVEVIELDTIDISTHKGEITVRVHGARDFEVIGRTHKGDLRFSGRDIPVRRDGKSSTVSYSSGSGGGFIEVQTHKGDIHIDFVD